MLRPGVNRHVRFGDDDDAAYAIGAEIVKDGFDNRATPGQYGLAKQGFQIPGVLQAFGIAFIKLQQSMLSEGMHQVWAAESFI